jgi:hypothetical protein
VSGAGCFDNAAAPVRDRGLRGSRFRVSLDSCPVGRTCRLPDYAECKQVSLLNFLISVGFHALAANCIRHNPAVFSGLAVTPGIRKTYEGKTCVGRETHSQPVFETDPLGVKPARYHPDDKSIGFPRKPLIMPTREASRAPPKRGLLLVVGIIGDSACCRAFLAWRARRQ